MKPAARLGGSREPVTQYLAIRRRLFRRAVMSEAEPATMQMAAGFSYVRCARGAVTARCSRFPLFQPVAAFTHEFVAGVHNDLKIASVVSRVRKPDPPICRQLVAARVTSGQPANPDLDHREMLAVVGGAFNCYLRPSYHKAKTAPWTRLSSKVHHRRLRDES
jgi:hypothetical protein